MFVKASGVAFMPKMRKEVNRTGLHETHGFNPIGKVGLALRVGEPCLCHAVGTGQACVSAMGRGADMSDQGEG